MPSRLPPLNALRAFEVVAHHDNFRAAAEELNVTPAAVIQHVKTLEEHLGRKLGHWPGWSDYFEAAGVGDIRVDRGPRFSDGALVIQAAVGGLGVALGSKALALEHLAAGRLVRLFDLSIVTNFAYYLVWTQSRADEQDLVAFRHWILAEARRDARPDEPVRSPIP